MNKKVISELKLLLFPLLFQLFLFYIYSIIPSWCFIPWLVALQISIICWLIHFLYNKIYSFKLTIVFAYIILITYIIDVIIEIIKIINNIHL